MAGPKAAKTAERKGGQGDDAMPCPECGKPTRIVKRMKNRAMGVPGGIYRSCSVCTYAQKL